MAWSIESLMATCCLTLYTHGYRYLPNRSSDTILPGAPVLSYLALTTSMPEVCTPVPFQQVMSSQTNITIFFSKVGGWERKRQGRSTVYQYRWSVYPEYNCGPTLVRFVWEMCSTSLGASSTLWICSRAHEWGYPLDGSKLQVAVDVL